MSKPELNKIKDKKGYFKALSALPVAVVVAEFKTGTLVYANHLAEELFGRKLQDLVGLNQKVLHPPARNQIEQDSFRKHQTILETKGRVVGIPNIALHANGSQTHVEITSNIVGLEGDLFMVGVFTTIEKRIQTQHELDVKSQELEAIFENSQVGIMLLKGYRVLARANQRLADILGYDSPQEMQNISMEKLHLSKKRFESYGEANYDTLAYRKNLHIEYQLRKKDGSSVWCRLSGTALDTETPADLSKGALWVVDDISDIKEAELNLTIERNLFRGGPTVVFQWQPSEGWPILYVSKNVKDVFGYRRKDLLKDGGLHFADLIHPDDLEAVKTEVQAHIANRTSSFEQTYQIKMVSGEYHQFYDYTHIEYLHNGEIRSIYGYLLDISEYLKAQEISSLLLTSTNEGIFGLDKAGRTTFINPAAAKILGYEESELVGHSNHDLIHHSDENGQHIPHEHCRMMLPLQTGKDSHVSDEVLWRKDGSSLPVEYRSTPIFRDDEVVGAVVTFHDISHRRAQEEKINHLAFHDDLTGLPNRRLFNDRLGLELKREKRSSERAVLLLLDVDHFKDINDTLGHPIGDELLKGISRRIAQILRESDTFARLGGDEFGILMRHDTGGVEATQVAERIIQLFKKPFEIEENQVKANTSIGITFCEPNHSVNDVVAQADIALYEAKNTGRGNFVFYETEMSNKVKEDVEVLGELSQALGRDEFEVYYQPQLDAITEKVVGLEALIRWFPKSEKAHNFKSPAKFIPVAESRGLIHSISIWQIHQIVEDIKMFREAGFEGRVSINISGELLNHIENLVELIEVIEHSDLHFREIEFEITETAYSSLSESENMVLKTLQSQGLELAIDDFGTGYSSLASLRQFRSSHLKIDKQFIDEVHCNDDDYAIVSATILMAHGLGKRVIAEGVELKEQLKVLKELNCDVIQGYFYAKPMPLDKVCDFIRSN